MFKKIKKIVALCFVTVSVSISPLSTNIIYAQQTDSLHNYFNKDDIKKWEKQMEEKFSSEKVQPDFKTFNRSAFGFWSWRDGVICISSSKTSGFDHGHAGIVATAPYFEATVEANPTLGVQIVYGMWPIRMNREKIWQLGVTKTTVQQDHDAADWAVRQLGKPYNDNFFDIERRDKFYCSHLVWAAYKDTANVDIGTWAWGYIIHPYELMDSNETTVIYRNH